jgi:hypothetical protein
MFHLLVNAMKSFTFETGNIHQSVKVTQALP